MKPTEVLKSEHRVIEVMLDCLDAISEQAEETGKLDQQAALDAVDFIKTFADGCHHGKEEGQLFPAMVEKGIQVEGGPIAVMLHEHEMGREFVRGMAGAIAGAAEGDAAGIRAFVLNARGYVTLLRGHIFKEDNILFPMADRVMTDADVASVNAKFDHVETNHMGVGTHERYLELAFGLAARYNVPYAHLTPVHGSGSCGCTHNTTPTR